MMNRKVLILSLAAGVGLGALTLVHTSSRQATAVNPPREAVRRPHPPGKIGPPAEIDISLAAGERAGEPVTISVTASSSVPVGSGAITLTVPETGEASAETVLLWSVAQSGYVDETKQFAAGALAKGLHQFTAILEFTPADDPAQPMAVSACLYLDVQADAIFASNVSFEQLKRMELLEELEQRVLAEAKPKLAAADRTTKAHEIAILKVRDPEFMARRIAEIGANDADVARRIEELNRIPARTETDSGETKVDSSADPGVATSFR